MSRNTETYFRSSLGLKEAIAPEVARDYHSTVVDEMRASGNRLQIGNISFRLAKEFGFCYGVDKAVDMAYETRAKFPDRRIFLTYEIIHNPGVNKRLAEMGIVFLSGSMAGSLTAEDIGPGDVVLLPAFGVPANYLEELRAKGCVLVDTTCGSVVHVWKRVERYARDGFTSLIHGKAEHAETLATVSQAQKLSGPTIVVFDRPQAQLVCDAIAGRRQLSDVSTLGPGAFSNGFDPETHLSHIGVANQTTMLASESLEIARMVKAALAERHGAENLDAHFRSFDTICSATQERQDAVEEMVREGGLDMMLVIGGYNSSNTGHLLELSSQHVPSWHISQASDLLSAEKLLHKPVGVREPIESTGWMPEGPVTIGLTAGASTPNRAVGETIQRIVELHG